MRKITILISTFFCITIVNAQSWNLTGNTGTNPGTQFIGTTDNQPLIFKTNNSEKLKLSTTGRLVFYNINSETWLNNLYVGGGNEISTGTANVSVGLGSMSSNTTGGGNTALGYNTLTNSTTASANVALGINAMQYSISANNNVAIGLNSLGGIVSGEYNTSVGFAALKAWGNTASLPLTGNTALGSLSLLNLIDGVYNTSIGTDNFKSAKKAAYNISLGYNNASNVNNATGNIYIGNNIVPYNSQPSNELNIGNWIVGNNGTIGIGQFTNQLPADGIGQDGQKYKLFVKDGIRTEKIKVDIASSNGWADYVFEKNYKLMPLNELDQFISKNGHLPEVPTTQQAIENGIELKEMNILLLKKIEELTLHIIQLNKKVEGQSEEIKLLKSQNMER